MKMERSLQPQSQTTDGLASLHPVPTAAGRMLVFMRISTDACQTGTDSIKWPSERFHEHQEATVAEPEHKNSIRQASKRTFPPEAAERRTLKNQRRGIKGATDVQQDRRSHFCRDRISCREQRKEREGGNGVIANKEEKGSEELQAGDSKENRGRQG